MINKCCIANWAKERYRKGHKEGGIAKYSPGKTEGRSYEGGGRKSFSDKPGRKRRKRAENQNFYNPWKKGGESLEERQGPTFEQDLCKH